MLFLIAAFVVLLIVGRYLEELTWEHIGVYALVALVALAVFWRLQWLFPGYMFFLVFLDAVLVLAIFKGDVVVSRR